MALYIHINFQELRLEIAMNEMATSKPATKQKLNPDAAKVSAGITGGNIKRRSSKWNETTCAKSALRFSTKSEWFEGQSGAYLAAKRLKIFDDCTKHMKGSVSWSLDKCKESASKYSSRSEWYANDPNAYQAALKREDWFEKCVTHMESRGRRYSDDDILADALKFKTRSEWFKESPYMYHASKKRGLFEKSVAHMSNVYVKWTEESCKSDAALYDSPRAWREHSPTAYRKAKQKGWYLSCTDHMFKQS